MIEDTTYYVYKWIRVKRLQKKMEMYKRTYNLVVDPVLVFYSILFLMFCLFIGYDFLQQLLPILEGRGTFIAPFVLIIPFIAVMSGCMTSLTDPGIRFGSSELQLEQLPHSRNKIIGYLFVEKTMIRVFIICLIPLPSAYLLMDWKPAVLWVFMLILSYPLSLWVQWKVFSYSLAVKILLPLSVLAMTLFYINGGPRLILFAGLTVIVFWVTMRKVEMNWLRMIDINDARIWNMWLVGQFTHVNIKPPKRYGVTKSIWKKKRGRHHSMSHLFGRIWLGYFQRSMDIVLKTISTVCLIVLVIPLRAEWMLMFTLPIAIAVYNEVAGGLFSDVENVFHAIPIEETDCKKSYLQWAYLGAVPMIVTLIMVQVLLQVSFAGIVMQVMATVIFVFFDLAKVVSERMMTVQKENFYKKEWTRVASLILIGAGIYQPLVLLGLPIFLLKHVSHSPIEIKE